MFNKLLKKLRVQINLMINKHDIVDNIYLWYAVHVTNLASFNLTISKKPINQSSANIQHLLYIIRCNNLWIFNKHYFVEFFKFCLCHFSSNRISREINLPTILSLKKLDIGRNYFENKNREFDIIETKCIR